MLVNLSNLCENIKETTIHRRCDFATQIWYDIFKQYIKNCTGAVGWTGNWRVNRYGLIVRPFILLNRSEPVWTGWNWKNWKTNSLFEPCERNFFVHFDYVYTEFFFIFFWQDFLYIFFSLERHFWFCHDFKDVKI
jgi:hypothetical protein